MSCSGNKHKDRNGQSALNNWFYTVHKFSKTCIISMKSTLITKRIICKEVMTQIQSMLLTTLLFTSPSEIQSAFSNKESVQKEVKATLSQKATLSCDVSDAKTEVKWWKDGKLLATSKTIRTESTGRSRQLFIDSVEKKDAGEYVCEAGTEKMAFKIHVAGTGRWVFKIINKWNVFGI
uniref:Ig-like domain-containing protein n=1 Tax=Gasterosteus aculeatus aculeatus TaxID=481459 RepID=A0AAQ4RL41_GASAC